MWQTPTNFLPWLLPLVQKQQRFLATKSMPAVSHSLIISFSRLHVLLVSENEFSVMTLSFPHVLEAHEQSLTEVHAIPNY